MIPSTDIAVTAAFIWEGVVGNDKQFVAAHKRYNGGAVEMAQDVTRYSELLNQFCHELVARFDVSFPGVFDYEVSEPFGSWWARNIGLGEIPTAEACAEECLKSTLDFFSQHGPVGSNLEDLNKQHLLEILTQLKNRWLD